MADSKIEVELRAKIDPSLMDGFNYQTVSEQTEHDVYYKFPSQPENSWIARTRQSGDKFFLTFKSKKTFGEGSWNEVNLPINSEQSKQLDYFFLENDFNVEVEIKKSRKTYQIEGMEVNIDQIENLGLFIEAEVVTDADGVEAAKDKIKQFFASLGIKEEDITQQGYVGLVRESQNGKTTA